MNDVQITAIALFWFVLPWLNASFDLISWQVSRRLGRHLLRQIVGDERGWLRQFWDNPLTHMAADILAAGFLLFGLAWALPAVIRLYNRFIESLGSSAPLVLDDYLCTAAGDPLGAGIWVTVMLISTLVPTLIHLGFVFASPFVAMFKPHPIWDARAAHLNGNGLPPAVDLRGTPERRQAAYDPANQSSGLAEDGATWLPTLHPETTKAVAWELRVAQPLLHLIMIAAAGFLVLDLVFAWDHFWTPVPVWLLWAAHGFDASPVNACAGVGAF